VLNGFVWNRQWTWKDARANAAHDQGLKFLAVNIVGYVLNTTIVVLIVAHFSTKGGLFGDSAELRGVLYNILSGEGKHVYPKLLFNGAQAAAVGIVVWWNYFANRFWTFKH
jgi:putative flippase GtrA